MIKPTIGRQVWYWAHGAKYGVHQPLAATVCFVHGDRMVNLQVISHMGVALAETSVPLVQAEDAQYAQGAQVEGSFCEWMPYQKAVASGAQTPTLHAPGGAA